VAVAELEEVEGLLRDLISGLERIDPSYRAMLPARRTIEAELPDLGVVYHAFWKHGQMSELHEGAAARPDIRIAVDSDDLIAIAEGELDFAQAYAQNLVRIRASMTDLLRLRAVM